MTIYTKVEIEGVEYTDIKSIQLNRSSNENNTTADFTIAFNNTFGSKATTFSLNNKVVIYADKDVDPATTNIFTGIIEDIDFHGSGTRGNLTITGRDYGATLQDIIVTPRIFKDTEASEIVTSLMAQNVSTSLVTANSVDVTGTIVDRITFTNVAVYDAIAQIAEIAGYFFYVDEDKDLNFKQKDAVSSGITFDNTNTKSARFRTSDHDIYNEVTVYGTRQLTGARDIFEGSAGSSMILSAKPHNTRVFYSGTENILLQPGGVVNVDNPSLDDVKYLVNFQGQQVIVTSGTTGGEAFNAGSTFVIDYDKSTPIVSLQQDNTSSNAYGPKDKVVTDKNVQSLEEAQTKAQTFLAEHKDPKVQGTITAIGILDVTPGETAIANLPNEGQVSQTYSMINAKYVFNKENNLSEKVLTVRLSKRIADFLDIMKEQILRLRALEAGEEEATLTILETATDSVGVSGTALIIQQSIGSGFWFGLPGHNKLNSPNSLLGPVVGGSTVIIIS